MSRPSPICEITTASHGDIDGILDLLESVAAERRWILTELPLDRERRRRIIAETMHHAESVSLIARAGAAIVGQLVLTPRHRGLLELGMVVQHDWRSKGVGRALLSHAIDAARNLGTHKIALEVFPHNPAAIHLYETLGFVREGYFRAHCRLANGDVWDTIPMGLLLE